MSSTAPQTRLRSLFRRRGPQPQRAERLRPDGSRDVELPLREHLIELRSRLVKAGLAVVIATVISFFFARQEVEILVRLAAPRQLIALDPTEAFVAHLKVALYTGLAASMPFLVYQLFRFLAPGLTRRERRAILISLPAVTGFFIAGVLFCYFVVLPNAIGFLLEFGGETIQTTPRVSTFLSFVTRFMMAIGLAFETPVIIFMLSNLGVATPQRLKKFRRWAYVLAFVIAAIITPTPDPINQTIVALPIILLYEVGIIFARLGRSKPQPTS